MTPALAHRLAGRPMLVLLDVDGTLSPIAERPELAIVPAATRDALTALVRQSDTHVALLSGRSARDAARLVGVNGVWVIGNHGIEVAAPNEPAVPRADVAEYADRITEALARCNAVADSAPGVVVEDKRWTLSVHYRLADRAIVPAVSAHVASIAQSLGLRLTVGKEVLELRPPVDVNKGTAALQLAKSLSALKADASVLCVGDDRTDEDAFLALRDAQPHAVTVFVGNYGDAVGTAAEFHVEDPDQVRALLETIVEQRSEVRNVG
jgi:trehalose 6-phosphate phosphatase